MEFIFSLFSEPAIIIGLIAFIGLIALRESLSRIITGTLKAIIGFIILGVGADAIASSLAVLGPIFQDAFNMQGVIPTNEAVIGLAHDIFGAEMAIIMAFGFMINIILACIKSYKDMFLTGDHVLCKDGLLAAVFSTVLFEGFDLVALGSFLLSATMVLTPPVVPPFSRIVTGDESIAMRPYNAL